MAYNEKQKEYYKEYRKKNAEKHREYNRKSYQKHKEKRDRWTKEYQHKAKVDVVDHYSQGKNCCACCGIKGMVFLTIDHTKGNGAEERKSGKHKTGKMFYIWLRKQGYPKGFQVLCHNCNQAKRQSDKCPHELLDNK